MKVQLNAIRKPKTHEGIEPVNHSPAFDCCRKLVKQGIDPKEPLEVYRGEKLAYTISSIGWGEKWKILENGKKGPAFKKYNPFVALKGRAAISGVDRREV